MSVFTVFTAKVVINFVSRTKCVTFHAVLQKGKKNSAQVRGVI